MIQNTFDVNGSGLREMLPTFIKIVNIFIKNGWTMREGFKGCDHSQVIFELGDKKIDMLPLFDAHIDTNNEWCLELYRHDIDKDIIYFTNDNFEEQELLEYMN